ncbi:MAG: hypothetical protein CME17_05035 [Gemmatimonadetes bacterium]|nr:hypothetical protein [Gemmatimonadota bacterium]|tara:strand:- start:1603 stop:1845 length:243 start_codon:yes stop_codon:yes gene_type:complete
MIEVKHSVWAHLCPEPYGRRELWTQDDWQRYEDRWRPEDYTGGRYDESDWRKYCRVGFYYFIIDGFDKVVADNWVAAGCP